MAIAIRMKHTAYCGGQHKVNNNDNNNNKHDIIHILKWKKEPNPENMTHPHNVTIGTTFLSFSVGEKVCKASKMEMCVLYGYCKFVLLFQNVVVAVAAGVATWFR